MPNFTIQHRGVLEAAMPYQRRYEARLSPQWWDDHIAVPWRSTCTIKLLMVADGATFDSGGGYKLSRVIEAIQHDMPSYINIDITTARHGSTTADASADINGLRFDEHSLDEYDQIWIFGVSSGNGFQPGEATALWEFMQGGGGVFATGDHEALGEGLCARIPRVRSMRRWYYPNQGPNGEPVAPARDVGAGRGEMDTTTPAVGGSDFDGIPQTINPKMYSSPYPHIFATREYPHPVLCGKDGMVTLLPDHMHEGLIEVPSNLEMPISVDGVAVEEYPRKGANRLPPEVIATSTINNNPAKGVFGVIGAYDGHQVDEIDGGVGRIVVDATWHHFWNMNVEQFAGAHDSVQQAIANGVSPDPADVAPADAWEQIRDYFQNIAFWLARTSTQSCIRRRGIWIISQHVDVVMALRSSDRFRLAHLIDVGTKAKDALQQIAPQCERVRITWEVPRFERIPLPWENILFDREKVEFQVPLLDGEMFEMLALGAQVEAIAEMAKGIESPDELAKFLDGSEDIDSQLGEAVHKSLSQFSERLRFDADRLDKLLDQSPDKVS